MWDARPGDSGCGGGVLDNGVDGVAGGRMPVAGGEDEGYWKPVEDRSARDVVQEAEAPWAGAGTYRRSEPKVGRNDPCPCGSGKKYKKCCGKGQMSESIV